jgi:hypothetical protein
MRSYWIAIGIALVWALSSQAQISPGPLSAPHQSLDSATQCTTCHKIAGGEPVFRCLDCHAEIASRIATHRGLHSTFNIPPGSSQECSRCHSDHNGRDFPLIKWDSRTFDHKTTGYQLEGKHTELVCSRCHTADHLSTVEKSNIRVKDLNRTFLGLSTACISCHQDKHQGRLGSNCQQCHNFTDWKITAGQFDHSKTQYPLTGLHLQVACSKCHTTGSDGQARYFGIQFGKCNDCHSDPHRGKFEAQTCQSCHNTSGWKHIATNALNEAFDHSKTKYPLLGKHVTVECVQCHANGDFAKPVAFNQCGDCHKDQHQGQFLARADKGECASCHRVEGFKPPKFTVQDHASSAYPLQGKHAKVDCAQCHLPRGTGTVYKLKFSMCTDCHKDDHQRQFAGPPYQNHCDQCHTLNGYKPSTFGIARHKQTRFVLTDSHLAVACGDCHKPRGEEITTAKALVPYRFQDLTCQGCHEDPHRGQFQERMQRLANGQPVGCQACHSIKSWKDLTRFDHSQTQFALTGSHRAVACIDCHKPPNLETTLLHADFRSAPKQCEDCHTDIHGKQFAKQDGITRCVDCHNSTRWKPALFDHDARTSFPLQGAHHDVRCSGCHKLSKDVDGKAVLFYRPTPKECAACHGSTTVGGKTSL